MVSFLDVPDSRRKPPPSASERRKPRRLFHTAAPYSCSIQTAAPPSCWVGGCMRGTRQQLKCSLCARLLKLSQMQPWSNSWRIESYGFSTEYCTEFFRFVLSATSTSWLAHVQRALKCILTGLVLGRNVAGIRDRINIVSARIIF